jgi:hypothetical protein
LEILILIQLQQVLQVFYLKIEINRYALLNSLSLSHEENGQPTDLTMEQADSVETLISTYFP